MFHDLLLLAKGGRTVYMGETSQALAYFENVLGSTIPPHVNPSDWYVGIHFKKHKKKNSLSH